MPRNVTIVSYVQYPSHVGLSYRISGLTESLSEAGFRCSVICPVDALQQAPRFVGRTEIEGLTIPHPLIDRESPFALRAVGTLLLCLRAVPAVARRYARKEVVVFEQFFLLPLMVLSLFMFCRRVVVDDAILLHFDKRGLRRYIGLVLDILSLGVARAITTASTLVFRFVKTTAPKKPLLFLVNGCRAKHQSTRRPLNESTTPMRGIFVGSMTFPQNKRALRNLLISASILRNGNINFAIDIVGGPLSIAARIAEKEGFDSSKVHVRGPLSNSYLRRAYESAQLGLLPFFSDTPLVGGIRTKALEYFEYGLLVISGSEGIGRLSGLKHGIHYLVANDVQSFADLVAAVIKEPDKYEGMRIAAAKFVTSAYSWKALVERLLRFLESNGVI